MRISIGGGTQPRGLVSRACASVAAAAWIALACAALAARAAVAASAQTSPGGSAATASPPAAARAGSAAQEGPDIQEVEVTGERPGPSLWRVSKGDHVLWLLGTLDPLPKRMTWRSREVEAVLAHADEVLPSPSRQSVSANIGPISLIRLYLQYRRTRKIPQKANLRDWLSPDLYARFTVVKARFDPHDRSIEELRPLFAALRLYDRAIETSQLTSSNDIQDEVLKLARRHHVAIELVSVKLNDPKGILTQVGEIPRAAEVSCLDATVARLETDIDAMKARAGAWARGDVDALRALPYPKQREVCTSAVATAPQIKTLLDLAERQWESALESALATRRTTLAMKPIYDLIGPNGILERLRAKGYTVEGP